MAKIRKTVEKKYPDLTQLFAAKEEARRKRAKQSPTEKFRAVQKLNELRAVLKTAKIIKRSGGKRG